MTAWMKHHGGHALIACGVAYALIVFGLSTAWATAVGCFVFPTLHEAVEILRGSNRTADWRDHVADWVSYQPAWILVLIGAGSWGYAGLIAVLIGVSYAATLKWSRPGPYQP